MQYYKLMLSPSGHREAVHRVARVWAPPPPLIFKWQVLKRSDSLSTCCVDRGRYRGRGGGRGRSNWLPPVPPEPTGTIINSRRGSKRSKIARWAQRPTISGRQPRRRRCATHRESTCSHTRTRDTNLIFKALPLLFGGQDCCITLLVTVVVVSLLKKKKEVKWSEFMKTLFRKG